MRLPLIVLAAGLTTSCSSLDMTPAAWFNSLFDAHITMGDILTYIIVGIIFLALCSLVAQD